MKKDNGGTTGRRSYSFKGLPWLRKDKQDVKEEGVAISQGTITGGEITAASLANDRAKEVLRELRDVPLPE